MTDVRAVIPSLVIVETRSKCDLSPGRARIYSSCAGS